MAVTARTRSVSAEAGGPTGVERASHDLARCSAGSAILEFALVLPILLALVAGCYEIGRALLVYQAMGEAARGGARYLARVPDPTCRPACSPEAARSLEMTRTQIADNTRVSRQTISVSTLPNPPEGMVAIRAEVALGVDLLATLGLERLLTLRITHFEARVAD